VQLQQGSYPGRPAFDTALSRALLHRVGEGVGAETLRLYQPDDVVAFSVLDRTRPGFGRALESAADHGFAAVLRLAGGRAALFHGETLAFAWAIPDARARERVHARFEEMAGLIAAALRRLGVDARVGEVPGEYCPGAHSVNARGRSKLMGVGQRVVRGAAHVGGVIVVGGSGRLRETLTPVYEALDFAWDPTTAGSVEDEVGAVTRQDVADALLAELAARYEIEPSEPDPEALALAAALEADHDPAVDLPRSRGASPDAPRPAAPLVPGRPTR